MPSFEVLCILPAVLTTDPTPAESSSSIRGIYTSVWGDLLRVYGNGTWVFSVTDREGRTDKSRIYARWPAVRIDGLTSEGASETVSGALIYTPAAIYDVRHVGRRDTYYLRWWTSSGGERSDVWAWYNGSPYGFVAEDGGLLPFMALSFQGQPLVQILSSEQWKLESERHRQDESGSVYLVHLTRSVPRTDDPMHLVLRFDPERHWTLQGWTWWIGEYRKEARACDLRYGREVDGVPIVEWAKVYLPHYDIVGLEARLISFDPTPPPMDLFRPEAFGIPAPRPSGGSHLWLWAALSALGLLTVLLAARLLAGRQRGRAAAKRDVASPPG